MRRSKPCFCNLVFNNLPDKVSGLMDYRIDLDPVRIGIAVVNCVSSVAISSVIT